MNYPTMHGILNIKLYLFVMSHRLDLTGFESRRGKGLPCFPKRRDLLWDPHGHLFNRVPSFTPEAKPLGRQVDHSPQSSIEN
jgi:hypothetical protein